MTIQSMARTDAFHLTVEGGVARLVLDRPPVNAIGANWLRQFHGRLDALAARDGYAEELIQSRRLYASDATRARVGAFLAGTPL